jgi:hypothetical protein
MATMSKVVSRLSLNRTCEDTKVLVPDDTMRVSKGANTRLNAKQEDDEVSICSESNVNYEREADDNTTMAPSDMNECDRSVKTDRLHYKDGLVAVPAKYFFERNTDDGSDDAVEVFTDNNGMNNFRTEDRRDDSNGSLVCASSNKGKQAANNIISLAENTVALTASESSAENPLHERKVNGIIRNAEYFDPLPNEIPRYIYTRTITNQSSQKNQISTSQKINQKGKSKINRLMRLLQFQPNKVALPNDSDSDVFSSTLVSL